MKRNGSSRTAIWRRAGLAISNAPGPIAREEATLTQMFSVGENWGWWSIPEYKQFVNLVLSGWVPCRHGGLDHGFFRIDQKSPDQRAAEQHSGGHEERSDPGASLRKKTEDHGRDGSGQRARHVHDARHGAAIFAAHVHGHRPGGANHHFQKE